MEIRLVYSNVKFQDNGKLKLLIIVGTRPEIIRLAAVITKCRKYFDVVLAHTGQNYDYNLNGVFFHDLKLDAPEVYMDAVGDDLGATVGNIINCSYKLMNQIKPDAPERPEALDKACFILAGIDEKTLLQAVQTAVDMNLDGDYGIPVEDYVEENVSTKVVKIIQSYTGVVDKMVWRKY